jgi:hypothetical protein
MNNYYLVISTLFFIFPLAIFSMNKHKNNYEKGLAFLLLVNLVISILFWLNPIQNSRIHFYDGFFGKISYLLFSIYILCIKHLEYHLKLVFLFILLSSLYAFYCSNSKSSKSWCCEEHVLYHTTFHALVSLGTAFAFF